MTQRRQLTLVAAACTLLASAPLSSIFASFTWAIDATFAVGAVTIGAFVSRAMRAPVWAQVPAMLAALMLVLSWLFHSSHELLGLIPTPSTFQHFGDLVRSGFDDVRDQGIPVPDRTGLLFLVALGIGLVAVIVDLSAVGLRRPALAGFPILALYSIPVFVHDDSVSFIPFVIGAVGFMWLLVTDNVDRVRRFGRRFTGDGRDVDLWEPSPLAAAGRRLAVVGVLLAVLLPLAVPGMTAGLVTGFGGAGSGAGGVGAGGRGASVNMFAVLSGQLNENQTFDMVKVTTNDPSPYYLRFGTADQLSTQGFSNRAPSAGAPVTSGIPDSHLNLPGVTQQTYSAQVTIENFDMGLAPVYGLLSKTGGGLDGSWLYDRNGQLVYSTRTSVKGKRYAFEFAATSYSKQVLESSPALDPNDPNRQYTQVPKVDAVQQQVAKLTRGKATPYDTVLALYDFFSTANGFSYALTTANGTSGSDIVDFLTHKKGYCEQYAAALAWMVRAAGIPARVAFGFTRGSNKDGNTYTLTNNNLHAWTEVYFKNIGWVPFDATPTSGISGSVSPAWAPDRDHQDAVTPTPGASGSNSGTTGGASSSASGGPHDVDNSGDLNFGTIKKPAPTWPWWLFGSGMALLVMLCVPAVGRTVMRRRRQIGRLTSSGARATPVAPDGEPPLDSPGQLRVVSGTGAEAARRDAHASWDELLDTLVDYRVPVHEAETPRVTALRVTRALKLPPPAAESLALLGRTEEWARYARQPVTDPGLGPALRAVRKSIRGTVSRRTRLRAALFPPSVMARWRTGSATAISAVVARSGRIRDGVLTALPPRRTRPARTR